MKHIAHALLAAGAVRGAAADPALPVALVPRAQSLSDCLYGAGVPTDATNSSAWNTETTPFNGRLPITPAAVAVPTSVAHVQAAVSCAVQAGVKVSPKSGGHSYASFGLGGEDGHLVISFSSMYNVHLDTSTNISEVQTGARLGHVFQNLLNGGRAISHGTCPGVGVGGHALHGGFGFSSHTHGLALDWLVGATVVLANSTVVYASATQNSDLFWALQGAGSSYGIVTSFFFKTFAAPAQTTPFTINFDWEDGDDMAAGWMAYQNFVQNHMPAELNMRLFLSPWTNGFQGLYHGNATACAAALQPLVTALNVQMPTLNTTDWLGGFNAWANGQTVDVTDNSDSPQENFYSKSLATTALPASAIRAASNYWASTARGNWRAWYLIVDAHGGNTSAVASVPVTATSYASRDKLFLYEFYDRNLFGSYPGPSAFPFLDDWVASLTNNLNTTQWGMYENYADPTMNRTYAQQVYFRGNLPRLQRIKYAVDPQEVFYFPQAIQPVQNAY